MKLIIAIIQPSRLEDVKAALTEVEVSRLTVMDCQGFGSARAPAIQLSLVGREELHPACLIVVHLE